MTPVYVETLEGWLRLKNRITGVGLHPDPLRHFGPGGVEEAERLCSEANGDFLSFIRPPADLPAGSVTRSRGRSFGRHRRRETFWFDSPLPSGRPNNDRVQVRLYRPRTSPGSRNVVVFHHPLYQKRWGVWEWMFSDLIGEVPVAMMAGPYHFDRIPKGEYAGEGTCNPNPWRLFEAIRQWCWDQQAMLGSLERHFDLTPAAVIGFSIGAFNSLLSAASGALRLPIVSIASTNRYAYGVFHGVIGQGIRKAMLQVGIDENRLKRMTESIQLERHMPLLRNHPVLYIDGIYDRVDPPPSLERLQAALRPVRSLHLPAGHATLILHRRRILSEIGSFFHEQGVF